MKALIKTMRDGLSITWESLKFEKVQAAICAMCFVGIVIWFFTEDLNYMAWACPVLMLNSLYTAFRLMDGKKRYDALLNESSNK